MTLVFTGYHKIFVYGTLKRGERSNDLMDGAEFIADAVSTGNRYKMNHIGYPILFEEREGAKVKGEIYRIPTKLFHRLDRYEGYPELYTRAKRKFKVNGKTVRAWVYIFNIFKNNAPLDDRWYRRLPGISVLPKDGVLNWSYENYKLARW